MSELLYFIINVVFSFEIVALSIAFVTLNNRLSKTLLIHYFIILIMILPAFLASNFNIACGSIVTITDAALFIAPVTFSMIIKNQFLYIKKRSIVVLYSFNLVGLFIYIISPDYRTELLYMLHIISWSFLLYFVYHRKADKYVKFYYILYIMHMIYIILVMVFFKRESIYLIVSNGVISIFTLLLIIFDYLNRVIDISKRFEKMYDINKKLSHTISRLKTSNEQIKKIILQKDLELMQLSRHASLAKITTGIAHEISQPLTGIKGIAQNMIDDINYDEFDNLQAVAELHRISSLVDKSSTIIDHIRNFSKKNIYVMKTIDLNTVVLDAIDLIHNQLKKSDVELIFMLDENLPKIVGNKISLEQLIVNLILNARDTITEKYQATPGFSGQIRVSTSLMDDEVHLTIEDNGTGIPDDIIQKIWSPFFTTKQRDQGTGIGLSICNRIIQEHKASLKIRTDTEGTSFIILFPIKNNK